MTQEETNLVKAARRVTGHWALSVDNERMDDAVLELQIAAQDFERSKESAPDAIREAKREAYEGAAKATCPLCAQGTPAHVHHDSPQAVWMHAAETDGLACGLEVRCEASAIRALKDSLVSEPVSS